MGQSLVGLDFLGIGVFILMTDPCMVPSRERSHITPFRKTRIIDSKVPAGMGYVSYQKGICSMDFSGSGNRW